MIARISLVRLRPELPRTEALEQWLGPHADVVRAMPEVREYVVALAHARAGERGWDAVATLRFDSAADLSAALEDPDNADALARTRAPFVERVEILMAEEHWVVRR